MTVPDLPEQAVAFGCSNSLSGVSTSRTYMGKELRLLLEACPIAAALDDYREAIVADNVLAKPSMGTRRKTFSYLRDRYGLDPTIPLFRVLRTLTDREPASLPVLALLVAVARDPLLRSTLPVAIDTEPGSTINSPALAKAIEGALPGKLTEKTRASSSENAMASWIQAGFFRKGRGEHTRTAITPTPATTTLALLLATIGGDSGVALLDSPWLKLIGGTPEVALSLAREAALHDWLELRNAGGVVEITFRRLAPELEEDAS